LLIVDILNFLKLILKNIMDFLNLADKVNREKGN